MVVVHLSLTARTHQFVGTRSLPSTMETSPGTLSPFTISEPDARPKWRSVLADEILSIKQVSKSTVEYRLVVPSDIVSTQFRTGEAHEPTSFKAGMLSVLV